MANLNLFLVLLVHPMPTYIVGIYAHFKGKNSWANWAKQRESWGLAKQQPGACGAVHVSRGTRAALRGCRGGSRSAQAVGAGRRQQTQPGMD